MTNAQIIAGQKLIYREPISVMEMELFERGIIPETDIHVHDYYGYGYCGEVKGRRQTYFIILPAHGKNVILASRAYNSLSLPNFIQCLIGR